MPVKTRKTICVDRQVSEWAQKEAKRLRVSYSWITETALREYKRAADSKPRARRPDPGVPHSAA